MAINLLALANQLRGNLHSSPSGSRTRSSDANEPGNLPSGSHIPGTDIKQDAGITSIARKGRKGDTKLRKVGGEVAHVNTTEANAIDALGPMGEAWVQRIGSGTRNPKTGLPEYHVWHPDHGAHTSFGESLERGYDYVTGGSGQSVSEKNEEAKNKSLYGSQYAESGGKQFYTDRLDDNLYKNIAGIQSTILEKGGELDQHGAGLAPGEGDLPGPPHKDWKEMMGKEFRFKPTDDDYTNFAPTYKTSEEDMLVGKINNLDAEYQIDFGEGTADSRSNADIQQATIDQTLKDSLSAVGSTVKGIASGVKTTAAGLSSGLFGMLTQSKGKSGQKNFAGSGDFQSELVQSDMIGAADQSFGEAEEKFEEAKKKRESAQTTAQLDTEEQKNLKGIADVALVDAKGGIVEQIQGLHDAYNEAFHVSANNWIAKKFG